MLEDVDFRPHLMITTFGTGCHPKRCTRRVHVRVLLVGRSRVLRPQTARRCICETMLRDDFSQRPVD